MSEKFPSIMHPTATLEGLQRSLLSLKEGYEILVGQRRTGLSVPALIESAQQDLSGLQGDVATLQTDVATLQGVAVRKEADVAITAVTNIEFMFAPDTYRSLTLHPMSYLPSHNDAVLIVQVHTTSGWRNSDYARELWVAEAAAASVTAAGSDAGFVLQDAGHNMTANDHASSILTIDFGIAPAATAEISAFWRSRWSRAGGGRRAAMGFGAYTTLTEAVDGVRVIWTASRTFQAVGRFVITGVRA